MKNIELAYNEKVRETEKAVCLNVMVSFNGNCSSRNVWFPKSVCSFITFTTGEGKEVTHAMVADWFLNKAESDNAFKGYAMRFETAFWN